MRIERTGPVEQLTPRIEKFLREGLGALSLDEVHSHERTRIDYVCVRGLVAIEIKTLEGAPSERTNNFIDTLRDRPDFPNFLGTAPLEAAFKNMEEPEKLKRALLERLGRTIVTHMKKANDQLHRHSRDYPRRNCLELLVLVNEDHPEYEPHTVAWIIQREMTREVQGRSRYDHIDAVLYFTERHGQAIDGKLGLPISAIQGPVMEQQPWKFDVLAYIVNRWSCFNDRPLHMVEDEDAPFVTIEHVPDKMPRHEMWRLEYRREPYLKALNDEQLRDAFDEVILMTTLFGTKGSPIKIEPIAAMPALERFTHIQIEMHERALSMDRFAYEFERELAAARRLKLSTEVVAWLHTLNDERSAR